MNTTLQVCCNVHCAPWDLHIDKWKWVFKGDFFWVKMGLRERVRVTKSKASCTLILVMFSTYGFTLHKRFASDDFPLTMGGDSYVPFAFITTRLKVFYETLVIFGLIFRNKNSSVISLDQYIHRNIVNFHF